MIRTTLLAVSSLAAAAFASAEDIVTFDADVSFDFALMESREGAVLLLSDVEDQARDACTYRSTITNVPVVDDICVIDIVHQVVAEMGNANVAAAYAESPLFVEAPVRLASAE